MISYQTKEIEDIPNKVAVVGMRLLDCKTNLCVKQTTAAVILTKEGLLFTGYNSCKEPQNTCPREGLPSGEGYELCKNICKQTGHAEVNACNLAGNYCAGATLYLFGHTYCCKDCESHMETRDIEEVIIVQGVIA